MQRTHIIALLTVLITIVSVTGLIASDPFDNEYSWMKVGENVYAGQVYIKIDREHSPLNIIENDGMVFTGIPSLDAVASAFGVYSIEKTYFMKESPKDPSKVDLSCFYTVQFLEEFGPVPLINAYENCSEIEFSEWVPIDRQFFVPNDERYRNQWHLEFCGFEEAWEITKGSPDVIIGIVDSGLDMQDDDGWPEIHLDMEANLWVNPGEDLNGNGLVDWEEYNEEDDDGNGYEDDFYGWDMTGRDNWPNDEWGAEGGHGTHVGGTAAEVTDNETGCAGAAPGCRLMYAGCYSTREPDQIQNGNAGVEYCVNNGAQIINCSWGSYSGYNNTQRAVFRYAYDNDVIVFAGAGNGDDNGPVYDRRENQNHFYPAAFDEVVSVSASNNRDGFANWATYGDFVELVAPGEGILAAFPHNAYRSAPGTSFSSPLTAGLAGLLLSVMPGLTPDEILQRMQDYSTDISAQNEDWPGIQYRINAGYLIGATRPKLSIAEWSLREIEGNGDRWPEPGERYAIDLTLDNMENYSDAEGLQFLIEIDDETITINNVDGVLGNIANGGRLAVNGNNSPTFTVGQSEPHYSSFSITFSADNFEDWQTTREIPVTIGHPSYMLVDDDGGDHFQTYYANDLSTYVHDNWDTAVEGYPGGLNSYEYVIWETGNAEDPLTEREQSLIMSYLDTGGSLIIAGQFIGNVLGGSDFHSDYLHANHIIDNTEGRRLFGVDGELTEGLSLLLIGGDAGGNGRLSPSGMVPLGDATSILTWDTDNAETAGVFYNGNDHRVIYLGFALEAASGLGGTTPRVDFLNTMLDNMGQTGVEDEVVTEIPQQFSLSSAYPNPFNSQTSVSVNVPIASSFELSVFNVNGQLIESLHNGQGSIGNHRFVWDAGNVSAGVYFMTLNWNNGSTVQKVVLVK